MGEIKRGRDPGVRQVSMQELVSNGCTQPEIRCQKHRPSPHLTETIAPRIFYALGLHTGEMTQSRSNKNMGVPRNRQWGLGHSLEVLPKRSQTSLEQNRDVAQDPLFLVGELLNNWRSPFFGDPLFSVGLNKLPRSCHVPLRPDRQIQPNCSLALGAYLALWQIVVTKVCPNIYRIVLNSKWLWLKNMY